MGLVLGMITGVFELLIQVIASFIRREVDVSTFTRYVSTAISFLIIGAAARRLAEQWKVIAPGWQVGAVIGGISEAIAALGGAVIVALSPVAQATLNQLSPHEQQLAQEPGFIIAAVSAEVATMVVFGAVVGWLAAWSVVRFGGPRGGPKGPRT